MGRQKQSDESKLKSQDHPLALKFAESVEDQRIYQEIIQGLYRRSLETEHIMVSVDHGTVYINGLLSDEIEKRKISEFISKINGVKDIKNEIHIAH